jgi:GT2 family glycosyltransferase
VIAFGCAITSDEKYREWALPGLRRAAEPDSLMVTRRDGGTLQAAYNSMIEEVRRRPDVEALVLLHQDTEIRDDAFAAKLRESLRHPLVGVVGVVGWRGVGGLGQWSDSVGAVAAPRLLGPGRRLDSVVSEGTVEAVDGLLMALSPWAIRTLCFDERFARWFHGYDFDLCFQARERGRRVVVADFDVAHHAGFDFFDRRTWVPAARLWHGKWARRPA